MVVSCTNGNYSVRTNNNGAGVFSITLKNESGVSLSDVVTISFAVVGAVAA